MWNYFQENRYMQTTKNTSGKRKSWCSLALISLFSVALLGCQKEQAPAEIPLLKVKTVTVDNQTSEHYWHLNGTLRARHLIPLALQVSGKVDKLPVDLGSRVTAGEALLSVDDADYLLAVKSVQAEIKATEAEIRQTKADLKRVDALLQRKLASEQAKQQLENQLIALQAQQNANQQQLQQVQNQLGYSTLISPRSGLIGEKMVEKAQVVSAGQVLFQLIADGQREIKVSVPENRIHHLPHTAQASINGKTYPLTIRTKMLQAEPASRTWNAFYLLPDIPELNRMPLNQTVVVQFTAENSGTKIPLSALYEQGDYPSVWLLQDSKAKRLPVEIVRLQGESAWVKADFPSQAKVIALGVHLLNEGQDLEEMP